MVGFQGLIYVEFDDVILANQTFIPGEGVYCILFKFNFLSYKKMTMTNIIIM